jgi:hypothetical protein
MPPPGEVIRTFEQTEPTEELLSDGVLVALVNPNTEAEIRRGSNRDMRLMAFDPSRASGFGRTRLR